MNARRRRSRSRSILSIDSDIEIIGGPSTRRLPPPGHHNNPGFRPGGGSGTRGRGRSGRRGSGGSGPTTGGVSGGGGNDSPRAAAEHGVGSGGNHNVSFARSRSPSVATADVGSSGTAANGDRRRLRRQASNEDAMARSRLGASSTDEVSCAFCAVGFSHLFL